MTKLNISYPERAQDLQVGRVEIVMDSGKQDRVEIWMLDAEGNRIEGGDFCLPDFIDHVLEFYNKNF